MSRPVFILTPGAWHTPDGFRKVMSKLEAQGYRCVGVYMPSIGRDPPVQNLDEDIAAVRGAVLKECDAGNDVVVCCHSWSGVVVGSALEGLGKEERSREGKKGVLKIAFMAALIVPIGVSAFDLIGEVPRMWRFEGDLLYPNTPIDYFYNDVEPEEAKYWASQIQSHAKATQYSKATAAAYLKIPSVYLITEDDRAIPVKSQEAFVKAAREVGSTMAVERVFSGHSPFLTIPDFVVDFLKRAAGDIQ